MKRFLLEKQLFFFKNLTFVLSFLILSRFNIDPDLGWHLALGNHFWQTGEILRKDIFSWTMPGYFWGNYFVLYQILVSFLFNNLGYVTTVLIFGLLGALAVFVLLPKKIDLLAVVPIVLGLAIVTSSLGVRPLMFSFLLFCLLLVLLEKGFFKKWWQTIFWFLFFALWANLHQGFLVGLLVFGVYILFEQARIFWPRLIFLLAAFLGTLATPFGVGLYQSIFLDLVGTKTWFAIAEYQPVVIYFPLNFLYASSGIFLILVLFLNRQLGRHVVWFLVGAFLFSLGFLGTNFSVFWAAIFIFLVLRYVNFVPKALAGSFLTRLPFIFAIVCVTLAFVGAFAANFLESADLSARFAKDGYPVSAALFLKKQENVSHLFNLYHWGGFIDWQAAGVPVFIDGRMTGWRNDNRYILADYLAILKGDCDLVGQYGIEFVLVERDKTPICFSEFKRIYQDDIAQVLVKE